MPEENAFWLLVASMHRPCAPLRELFLPGMVKVFGLFLHPECCRVQWIEGKLKFMMGAPSRKGLKSKPVHVK